MKKTIITFVCGCFLTGTAWGQATAKQWTFKECVQYALEHNIQIKQRELQKEDAEVQVNTAKMSRLPNLNAGVDQNWNFGRSNQNLSGIYEEQQISNTSFGVSSSVPIFTGMRITNEIEQKKLDLDAATHSLNRAKEDLALNVASLYLQVLFNKEILMVSNNQLTLTQDQVSRTQTLVNTGKVPESQLYDIKAQAAQDEVRVREATTNLQLSLLDLAQNLELNDIAGFDITAPLVETQMLDNLKSLQLPDEIFQQAVAVKPVIKEQESLLESSKSSLEIAKSGYYPKLDLNLRYSNNYFYKYGSDNIALSNQFKNNAGEMIGLSLSVPIFNRFQVRNQVKRARLNIQNQQLTLENTQKILYKEIQTAYYNAIGAQEKFKAANKSVDAANESFKYATERYESGKTSVFEFNEAKNKMTQSLSEQIQAKYDYVFRSKILDFYSGNGIDL